MQRWFASFVLKWVVAECLVLLADLQSVSGVLFVGGRRVSHISEPSRQRCFGTTCGPFGVHFCRLVFRIVSPMVDATVFNQGAQGVSWAALWELWGSLGLHFSSFGCLLGCILGALGALWAPFWPNWWPLGRLGGTNAPPTAQNQIFSNFL